MMTQLSTTATIRAATDADLSRIATLLVASGLPTAGVADALCGFLVAEHDGALVGVVWRRGVL